MKQETWHSPPVIDKAVGKNRTLFLERMASIARAQNFLTVELFQDNFLKEDLQFANFRLPDSDEDMKSGGQLIVRHGEARVRVEMYFPPLENRNPSREEYVNFSREIFFPLLRAYNQEFCTHFRMRVARPKEARQLPKKAMSLFDRFSKLANTRSLHPYDWERFYLFVRNSRQEAPWGTLRELLIERGFSREKAEMLCELNQHLWNYKRLRR